MIPILIQSVLVFILVLETPNTAVQGYTVRGCVGNQILLNCRSGVIQIQGILLADSTCYGSGCCPRENDCNGGPSEPYRNSVQSNCNGRSNCQVNVEQRNIGCGLIAPSNDYVNITYTCQAITTTPWASTPRLTTLFFSTPTSRTPTSSSTKQASTSFILQEQSELLASERKTGFQMTSSSSSVESQHHQTVKVTSSSSSVESQDHQTVKVTSKSTQLDPKIRGEENERFKSPKQEALERKTTEESHTYMDKITTICAVVVGGVVITATVISAAVVIAIKKRRIPKKKKVPTATLR